jgi:hypothetical protein
MKKKEVIMPDNNNSGSSSLAFFVVAAGVAVAASIYLETTSKNRIMKKLFFKIEDELENKFPKGTEFILLDKPDEKLVDTNKKSLQCLIIPPGEATSNSLGARLLVLDNFSMNSACDVKYYKVNFNPIQRTNQQLDLTQYNNVYPKAQLLQNIRKDVRYSQELHLLGSISGDEMDFESFFNTGFETRYEANRESTVANAIALAVEHLVKKSENALAMNNSRVLGNSSNIVMIPAGTEITVLNNPKARRKSKRKKSRKTTK